MAHTFDEFKALILQDHIYITNGHGIMDANALDQIYDNYNYINQTVPWKDIVINYRFQIDIHMFRKYEPHIMKYVDINDIIKYQRLLDDDMLGRYERSIDYYTFITHLNNTDCSADYIYRFSKIHDMTYLKHTNKFIIQYMEQSHSTESDNECAPIEEEESSSDEE